MTTTSISATVTTTFEEHYFEIKYVIFIPLHIFLRQIYYILCHLHKQSPLSSMPLSFIHSLLVLIYMHFPDFALSHSLRFSLSLLFAIYPISSRRELQRETGIIQLYLPWGFLTKLTITYKTNWIEVISQCVPKR